MLVSSPAGVSGNCLLFIYVLMSRPSASILLTEFQLLYCLLLPQFTSLSYCSDRRPFVQSLTFPFICVVIYIGDSESDVLGESFSIDRTEHFAMRLYYWQSSMSHSLKGKSCKTTGTECANFPAMIYRS